MFITRDQVFDNEEKDQLNSPSLWSQKSTPKSPSQFQQNSPRRSPPKPSSPIRQNTAEKSNENKDDVKKSELSDENVENENYEIFLEYIPDVWLFFDVLSSRSLL